jgi:hypothetical protein
MSSPYGLVGLSGIEGLGGEPTDPSEPGFWTSPSEIQAPYDCQKQGGTWDAASNTCVMPTQTFEMKTWPELTAYPTAVEVGKALSYAVMTIGGAYYHGWKGGVAGFFGSAALNSAAGALVYYRQPEPQYKLAMYLTVGLGAVAAVIAVPAWLSAERIR